MNLIKMLHKKTPGIGYEHIVLAYAPWDCATESKISAMAKDIMAFFSDYQSFWAVHTNTDYLHAHVVMNNIDCRGNSFKMWKPKLNQFRAHINDVAQEYGLQPLYRTCGSKPVAAVDELELTAENENLLLEGNKMENFGYVPSYGTMPVIGELISDAGSSFDIYDDGYSYDIGDREDNDNNISEVLSESSFAKGNSTISIGTSIAIASDSEEKAARFVAEIREKIPKYTAQEILEIAKGLPPGMVLDAGPKINVILSDCCKGIGVRQDIDESLGS